MTATLLNIEQGDKVLTVTELGTQHGGIIWTIQPGDEAALQNTIDMINAHGGPDLWSIALTDTEPTV